MKRWTKLGLMGAAVVLAIAAGTAAYAMRAGDDGAHGGENSRQSESPASGDVVQEGDDSGAAGICLAGDAECVETFDGPAGEPVVVDCEAAAPCVDIPAPAPCPADTGCPEPLPVDDVCYGDATQSEIKECEARRAETAAMCAAPEPGAPVTDCNDTPCVGVEPLPAPAVNLPATEPGTGVREPDLAPPPQTFPCPPIDKCGAPVPEPAPAEDGATTTSHAPCDPPECDSRLGSIRCLPPDCSVSSDGAVACPGAPPICDAVDGGCAVPPNPGSGGGSDPSGGGSAGSGVVEPGVIEPSFPE